MALGGSVLGLARYDNISRTILSFTIPTTPAQDELMQIYINNALNNFAMYNLYSNNCATFVQNVLNAAGIATPGDILPGSLFNDLDPANSGPPNPSSDDSGDS
jgi:hypothetical protein